MASEVVSKLQNLVTGESKSARKKKSKQGSAATAVPAATENTSSEAGATAGSDPTTGHLNGDNENSYIKELQK